MLAANREDANGDHVAKQGRPQWGQGEEVLVHQTQEKDSLERGDQGFLHLAQLRIECSFHFR